MSILSPYKVIFKYKNNERKIQNLMYIFVGTIGLKCYDIFEKIKNLSLYETLNDLNKKEIEKLESLYGISWYMYFFNIYHIGNFVKNINKNKSEKQKMIDKYGNKWLNDLIDNVLNLISITKNNYSYAELLYNKFQKKMGKNILNFIDEEDSVINEKIKYGGANEEIEVEDEIEDEEELNEMNFEDIEKMYSEDKKDDNFKKTKNEINDILEKKEKKNNIGVEFPTYKNNNIETDTLEKTYKKIFVYGDYIYEDDSIIKAKNKICKNILNNSIFGENAYLIPSRIYLWCEYVLNEKIEKIMLGHVIKNSGKVMDVSIEPMEIFNYENLDGSIKNLYNLLKYHSNKINYEILNDEILSDYKSYMMNNEIYMIDIYNEIGDKHKIPDDKINNVLETYIKLYFPFIKKNDFYEILKFVNGEKSTEETHLIEIYNTLHNDLTIEKKVMDCVDEVKFNYEKEYLKMFSKENLVTQSNLYINLQFNDNKIQYLELFNIFNDFELDDSIPFIQYNVIGKNNVIAYYEEFMINFSKEKSNMEIVKKWFENAPYGISFKLRTGDNKFVNVTLNEVGKIDYKIIWAEADGKTINDISSVFDDIQKLVIKINKYLLKHPQKLQLKIPEKWETFYIFVNTFQKFSFPKKEIINHNDLYELSDLLFPYVYVIENFNISEKDNEKVARYGTYLQYKRISNFNSDEKMEQRILTLLKRENYEDILLEDLQRIYNLTKEQAQQAILNVKEKYENNTKKNYATLNVKNEGVRVDIQGKDPENYVIKINGARNEMQVENIILFMKILIFMYYEIYIKKTKYFIDMKNQLQDVINIARKRRIAIKIISKSSSTNKLKKLKEQDIKRLYYKPSEGQSHWSRLCQNSGEKNKRRPQVISEENIKELIKNGYVLNKKTGEYEKNILLKNKNKITLKAIKLNDEITNENVYYTCDPSENNENMYIGFLTKNNNPLGLCMPCCFKKDKFENMSEEYENFYKSCKMGKVNFTLKSKNIDNLYILHETIKLTEGRFCYLNNLLDYFFNKLLNLKIDIKAQYLQYTEEYYFKYGINTDNYSFLNSLQIILNMSELEIKNHIIDFLKKDVDENYYINCNDGEIAKNYKQKDFMNLITNSKIDFYYIKDFLKIKGLFTKNGIMPIVINYSSQKGDSNEDFYIEEDMSLFSEYEYWKTQMPDMDLLFFVKEAIYYYPIVKIIKKNKTSNDIIIEKFITNTELKKNILSFVENAVINFNTTVFKVNKTAHETELLINNNKLLNDYSIVSQIIDTSYKCRYIVCKNNCIIPVEPSRILLKIPFVCFKNNNNGCSNVLKKINLDEMYKLLNNLYEKSDKHLNIKPLGVYYTSNKNDEYEITGIFTSGNTYVSINPTFLTKKELDEKKIIYKNQPFELTLDEEIISGNTKKIINNQIIAVNNEKYNYENYQLFRYEFSHLINSKENYKNELNELIKNKKDKEIEKFIKDICFKENIIELIEHMPNLMNAENTKELKSKNNFEINNQRVICNKLSKTNCQLYPHCNFSNNKCKMTINKNKINNFIKKIVSEIIPQKTKYDEIFNNNGYYVSDIVNYNYFNKIKGKEIIGIENINLEKKLKEIFKDNSLPILNKRTYKSEINIKNLNKNNPLKELKLYYTQNIFMNGEHNILRAYTNGYYWIKHMLFDTNIKNLGYFNFLQNQFINIFISKIIDWLNIDENIIYLMNLDNTTKQIINNSILNCKNTSKINFIVSNYIINLINNEIRDLYLFELLILHFINGISIVLLIDSEIAYFINNNKIIKTKSQEILNKENICINFEQIQNNSPQQIEIIYYK